MELGSGSREEEMPPSPADVEDGTDLLPSPGELGLCLWPYLIVPQSIPEQQSMKGGLSPGLPIPLMSWPPPIFQSRVKLRRAERSL